jgi:tRNA(Arg) A34 adenosine deaminase TadA
MLGLAMNVSFMHEAIRLSLEKMREGRGGPFGAVVVKAGQIISRGWNEVTTTNDPTAHAEVVAIREACRVLQTFRLDGCELYASCEPCPMCLSAIYWARIERLFFAATRQDAAAAGFDDDLLYREIPLPFDQRRLPTRQLLRDAALPSFAKWRAKADKIPY